MKILIVIASMISCSSLNVRLVKQMDTMRIGRAEASLVLLLRNTVDFQLFDYSMRQ